MVIVIQVQVNLNLNVNNPSHANATIECNTSTTAISISIERQQPITRGMTSFQNVTFFLSDTAKHIVPVLQNVTLNIPKEKAAAIVGSTSGAGKSTIISLFYDINSGSIPYERLSSLFVITYRYQYNK